MDNFELEITSSGEENLRLAMKLIMNFHGKIEGYSVADEKLLLHWCKPSNKEGYHPLPVPFFVEDAIAFLWSYIQNFELTKKPAIDGTVGKGFYITNRYRKKINDCFSDTDYSVCAVISVVPALYHK